MRRTMGARAQGLPEGALAAARRDQPALERLNGEIERRTRVVGVVPDTEAVVRLVGAILREPNDGWAVARRDMTLETIRPGADTVPVSPPAAIGGDPTGPPRAEGLLHHLRGHDRSHADLFG